MPVFYCLLCLIVPPYWYLQIRELHLEEHFDEIVVSGDLKWEKPQPEIFHRICSNLGVQPFECLIVGDKIETDILGGFQAQLGIVVWLPLSPSEEKPDPSPDYTISDISQLVTILKGGNDKKSKGHSGSTKGKSAASLTFLESSSSKECASSSSGSGGSGTSSKGSISSSSSSASLAAED